MEVQNGIDHLLCKDFGLLGKRLGLITNQTGISSSLVSTIDIIKERYDLQALYAPEHGVRGDVEAGGAVKTYQDTRTGLPVYSIYNTEQGKDNRPAPAMLEPIDMLLFDIQDVGCRFYTFISTMYNAMEVCAAMDKTFVVLDRLNPINGITVEGNMLDPQFKSFIGIASIPQRHGMTVGELAGFFNQEYRINCKLNVIPLKGWKREQFSDEAGIAWVNPSPNMPSVDAALLYPGTCFFEGTNISEGRGTTKPFEMIGAPWLDAEALADTLNAQKTRFPGLVFRPVYFTPWTSKFQGELCRGVQPHIVDRQALKPVSAGLWMLEAIRNQNRELFAWRPQFKERYFIDLLAGTDMLRTGSIAEYLASCEKDSIHFADYRRPYLLY